MNLSPNEKRMYLQSVGLSADTHDIDTNGSVIPRQANTDITAPEDLAKGDYSKLGTVAAHAGAGVLPTIAGAGAGMLSGAGMGMLTANPVGILGGAILGGITGGYGASKLQEAVLPDAANEYLAGSAAENPYSALGGGLISALPTFRFDPRQVGVAAKALMEGKMARNLFQNQKDALVNVGVGAGLGGGMSIYDDVSAGRDIDPLKALIGAAGEAFISNPNTKIGRKLGMRPNDNVSHLVGRDVLEAGSGPTLRKDFTDKLVGNLADSDVGRQLPPPEVVEPELQKLIDAEMLAEATRAEQAASIVRGNDLIRARQELMPLYKQPKEQLTPEQQAEWDARAAGQPKPEDVAKFKAELEAKRKADLQRKIDEENAPIIAEEAAAKAERQARVAEAKVRRELAAKKAADAKLFLDEVKNQAEIGTPQEIEDALREGQIPPKDTVTSTARNADIKNKIHGNIRDTALRQEDAAAANRLPKEEHDKLSLEAQSRLDADAKAEWMERNKRDWRTQPDEGDATQPSIKLDDAAKAELDTPVVKPLTPAQAKRAAAKEAQAKKKAEEKARREAPIERGPAAKNMGEATYDEFKKAGYDPDNITTEQIPKLQDWLKRHDVELKVDPTLLGTNAKAKGIIRFDAESGGFVALHPSRAHLQTAFHEGYHGVVENLRRGNPAQRSLVGRFVRSIKDSAEYKKFAKEHPTREALEGVYAKDGDGKEIKEYDRMMEEFFAENGANEGMRIIKRQSGTTYKDFLNHVKAKWKGKYATPQEAIRDLGLFGVTSHTGKRFSGKIKSDSVGRSGEDEEREQPMEQDEFDFERRPNEFNHDDLAKRAEWDKLSEANKKTFRDDADSNRHDRFQPHVDDSVTSDSPSDHTPSRHATWRSMTDDVRAIGGDTAKKVADGSDGYFQDKGFYEGKFANSTAKWFDGFKIVEGQEENIARYLHERRHALKKTVELTPEEQAIADQWYGHLGIIADEHTAKGMKILTSETLRDLKKNPNYSPDIAAKDVVYELTMNSRSARAKELRQDYVDWLTNEKDMPEEQAIEHVTNYIKAIASRKGPSSAVEFNAMKKAEGYGLPWSWMEKNAKVLFDRYGRRTARHMAFYDNLQKHEDIRIAMGLRDQDGSLDGSKEGVDELAQEHVVRNLVDHIKEVYTESVRDFPMLNATARLVNNSIMGTGTGLRDILNMPAQASPYLSMKELGPAFKGAMEVFQHRREAFEAGATSPDYDRLQFGEMAVSAPDSWVTRVDKMSHLARKWSGRQWLENMSRELTYSAFREVVLTKVAEGDTSYFTKHNIKPGVEMDSPEFVQRATAALVRKIQGGYDASGLPKIAIDSPVAPFLQIARWSIEKMNRVAKDVVKPAYKDREYGPLLRYTLGTLLSGVAIEELNELLSNRRGHEANVKESFYSNEAELGDMAAKVVGLFQLGAFGGIFADGMKTVVSGLHGGDITYSNPLSFPAATMASETVQDISNLAEAIREGEDILDVLPQFMFQLIRRNNQTLRYAIDNTVGASEAERKETNRDLAVFNRIRGERGSSGMGEFNPYLKTNERDFKREKDVGKAAAMLPSLIEAAVKRAGNDPYKLAKEIGNLRKMSYTTMPSPKTDPVSFSSYVLHIKRTRGEAEANRVIADYFRMGAVNKAKASLVPQVPAP